MELKYRLFTLEANFIAMDAISDMLFYSENGKIKLFPAIPKEWKNAEFNDFRGYDGISVSAKLENGEIVFVKIKASNDCEIELLNDLSKLDSRFKLNEKIALKAHEEIVLRIK